jgi:hypothetical protein
LTTTFDLVLGDQVPGQQRDLPRATPLHALSRQRLRPAMRRRACPLQRLPL